MFRQPIIERSCKKLKGKNSHTTEWKKKKKEYLYELDL